MRQRVAKFGATMEDRLKLRMKFADVNLKEDKANELPVKKTNYQAMLEGSDDS